MSWEFRMYYRTADEIRSCWRRTRQNEREQIRKFVYAHITSNFWFFLVDSFWTERGHIITAGVSSEPLSKLAVTIGEALKIINEPLGPPTITRQPAKPKKINWKPAQKRG